MTASIKEREDKLCDREDTSKTKKLSLKTKKELNRQETLEAKNNRAERQVEKDEDNLSYLTGTLMDKEQRLAERAQISGSKKAIAETA